MKKRNILIYSLILKAMLIAGIAFVGGCANKKPELAPTQIVEGKSIIVPPEFNVLPESAASTEE